MVTKEMTIQEKIAYLAGLVDGEGHIGVYNSFYSNGNIRYRGKFCITNTCPVLLEWLLKEFGGYVKYQKVYSNKHKKSYSWNLNDNDTDHMIEMVLPYLIIKKRQAMVYLGYRKLQKSTPKTFPGSKPHCKELRKEVFDTMKLLNKRGPKSVEANTLDINKVLMKIESELGGDIKRRVGDDLPVS